MAEHSEALPRRNPLPRQQRRRSIDGASAEELAHFAHLKINKLHYLSCWYCWHNAAEHLDHDWLVDGCPDCEMDAARG